MTCMNERSDPDLDATFHALADATRRAILEELQKREGQALFEICVRLNERHGMNSTRQTISKHLAVLEEVGLVEIRWEGRTKLHSSNLKRVAPRLIKWLNQHLK
jgi:DNA-binding transcriptional ArsR family regulator